MRSTHCESPVAAGRYAAWLHLHGTDAAENDGCEVTYPDGVTPPIPRDLNQIMFWVERDDFIVNLPGQVSFYVIYDGSGPAIRPVCDDEWPHAPWMTNSRREAVTVCRFFNAHRITRHEAWLATLPRPGVASE